MNENIDKIEKVIEKLPDPKYAVDHWEDNQASTLRSDKNLFPKIISSNLNDPEISYP